MQKPIKTLVNAAVIGTFAVSTAQAGGFSLYTESSAVAIGNYAAGIAAEAADASTGWYNPAGLVLIHDQQLVLGGVGVFPHSELSGTSTFTATPPLPNYVQHFSGIEGGENAFVPFVHYALPLGPNATAGLSIVSPFGLATDWGATSPVRYEATFTELLTTNVSPELGGRINEHFSIGAGLDLQYAQVKFNRMLGIPTIFGVIVPPFNASAVDSLSYNKGHSFAVGFHAGVMGMFNDEHTRLGLNYQSKVKHEFHGYSRLSGVLANNNFNIFGILPSASTVTQNNDLFSNQIEFPDILTLSAFHDLNERISLLGSVVYSNWNDFDLLQLSNVQAPVINPRNGNVVQGHVTSVSPQNYSDVWRFAVGANYHVNPNLMLRVGGGYDETPTNDIDRDVRLPDTDRWALSIGAHYQARYNVGIDVGYTHLFAAEDPTVNRTDPVGATTFYTVNAVGNTHADLVGAQVVWAIDKQPVMITK